LFEVPPIFLIDQHEINGVLHRESVVDVLVGGSELHTVHVHADGYGFALIGAAIHNFVFHKVFCFGFGLVTAGTEGFLSDEVDLHELDLEFNQVKQDSADDYILEVIEMFIELELDVEAVFNAHLHLHLCGLLGSLDIAVVVQYGKIEFLDDGGFEIAIDNGPNEVPDPPGNAIEGLVLLLEVGKLEFKGFGLCEDTGWFKLFLEGVELG
jgi:hypothetical protein